MNEGVVSAQLMQLYDCLPKKTSVCQFQHSILLFLVIYTESMITCTSFNSMFICARQDKGCSEGYYKIGGQEGIVKTPQLAGPFRGH